MQIIINGIEQLKGALLGSYRVLLVCDASFPFLNIKDSIEDMEIPYVLFCDFTLQYEDVCKGVEVQMMSEKIWDVQQYTPYRIKRI